MAPSNEAVEVRCVTCHRVEAHQGDAAPVVVSPGGARRVEGAPERAAWSVVERTLAAGGPRLVAACAACGQPMIAPATSGLPRISWTLSLPDGELSIDAERRIEGPDGRLTTGDARAFVLEQTKPPPLWQRLQPAQSLFQTALIGGSISGPLLLFLMALVSLSIFMREAAVQWAELGVRVLSVFQ